MRDPRLDQFADVLVNYSTRVQPGDHVMIEHTGEDTQEIARACLEKVVRAGGIPTVVVLDHAALASFIAEAGEEQIRAHGELELEVMKRMKVFIAIRGTRNVFELGSVPEAQMRHYNKYVKIPVHLEQRVRHTRWVVTRYPNASMAQNAARPTRDFEDFYFQSCLLDWKKMARAQEPLVALMNRTDRVRITGKGTDISFSIKGIPAINCSGTHNIPDGECFTAPVRESVNGVVQFNTKTVYEGVAFQNIRLEFENGRVVRATDELNPRRLNEILDKDAGSRYVGEFAIGFHPIVREPMLDILFDEKIAGSFHMALGQCYKDETPNGNDSSVHWDMVCIQRPEYGGGKIIFDDVVIREDGIFVLPELRGLNPENLA